MLGLEPLREACISVAPIASGPRPTAGALSLWLVRAASRAIDHGRVAGVAGCQLHIDRCEFSGPRHLAPPSRGTATAFHHTTRTYAAFDEACASFALACAMFYQLVSPPGNL